MIDLLLMLMLGFLGSFGHCASMCGSLAVALATNSSAVTWKQAWWFHGAMNLGRVLSYGLGGAALGGVSAAIVSGGQLVGIGSQLRSIIALLGIAFTAGYWSMERRSQLRRAGGWIFGFFVASGADQLRSRPNLLRS
jgi:sulfite exporter TauE/SafE